MRLSALVIAMVLLSVGAGDCSGTTTRPHGAVNRDNGDPDDSRVRTYGHPASAEDVLAVVQLVKRYYRAAVSSDAKLVCSLAYRSSGNVVSFPEGYALEFPSAVLNGKNCVQFVSLLLRASHRALVAGLATVKVSSVRNSGSNAFALLAYVTLPDRVMAVKRISGHWKVATLLPSPVP